jgi:hypothetical protein
LEYADFSRRLSSAEIEELESLQEAYPPDPDHPLKDAFEAYGRASAESSPSSKETPKK